MRERLTFDDMERLQASARTPAAHREAAASLAGRAEARHPGDEVTPADLLSAAAWHLERAGDPDAAIALYRRAVAAEGTTTPDVRCSLANALLLVDRPAEAREVADELRRSRPRIVDVASMAEVFHLAGDLRQAHRWVEMGISRLELTEEPDLPEDYEIEVLLNARRRVRRALGFPPDQLDA